MTSLRTVAFVLALGFTSPVGCAFNERHPAICRAQRHSRCSSEIRFEPESLDRAAEIDTIARGRATRCMSLAGIVSPSEVV